MVLSGACSFRKRTASALSLIAPVVVDKRRLVRGAPDRYVASACGRATAVGAPHNSRLSAAALLRRCQSIFPVRGNSTLLITLGKVATAGFHKPTDPEARAQTSTGRNHPGAQNPHSEPYSP